MANTNITCDYYPLRIENQTGYFTITSGDVPVRNMAPTAFEVDGVSRTWKGWFKVDVPSERACQIHALVDDNGSFTINGVTTEIPEGAHGSRRSTPQKTVTLKPGYYFAACRMQNLTPREASYPNVEHFQAFVSWEENGETVTRQVSQLYNIVEKGLRNVTIVITGTKEDVYHGARSFPREIEKENGELQYYDAPVYRMYLRGTDDDGNFVERLFQVIRFMPGYNPDPDFDDTCKQYREWPVLSMVGLKDEQGINTTYKDYFLHGAPGDAQPDDGAFILNNSFLLHDGPDEGEDGFGAFGCCEVYGNNGMQALKEGIAELSGMEEGSTEEKIQALCQEKKLYIFIEGTARPEIVPSN